MIVMYVQTAIIPRQLSGVPHLWSTRDVQVSRISIYPHLWILPLDAMAFADSAELLEVLNEAHSGYMVLPRHADEIIAQLKKAGDPPLDCSKNDYRAWVDKDFFAYEKIVVRMPKKLVESWNLA